jgi:hypothetical protein
MNGRSVEMPEFREYSLTGAGCSQSLPSPLIPPHEHHSFQRDQSVWNRLSHRCHLESSTLKSLVPPWLNDFAIEMDIALSDLVLCSNDQNHHPGCSMFHFLCSSKIAIQVARCFTSFVVTQSKRSDSCHDRRWEFAHVYVQSSRVQCLEYSEQK